MGSVINIMALVVFATSLFSRSVDPVIPQIALGLNVAPATAALLSTGFTLPYALIQPLVGALADMFSKTRLIVGCMVVLGSVSMLSGLSTNFELLLTLRVIAGCASGGVFPIALAVVADRVPIAERQVAIGRVLAAALTGNLLGATASGVIGDLIGWRGVFFTTGAICLLALFVAVPALRTLKETTSRFDLSTLWPNYRTIFRNPMAKYCFGAVFVEAIFMFGVFPYMAVMLNSEGETRASIAGLVIAGFAIGGIAYTFVVSKMLALFGERRLMVGGGLAVAACLVVIALRAPWPVEFVNFIVLGFGFYSLHGCIHIYVTELAPSARATAMSGHTAFFFLGQAIGPVIYGIGLDSIGLTPLLLTGAVAIAVTGCVCALCLRHQSPAVH
ncbi:MAG TPA: MFS transporter [Pseudolabrys sp.]|jgi:predicted MFS family arabinose efflux permease